MQPEEFADVLHRAQAGDEMAFSLLFRDVQPAVLRYLSSLAPAAMVDDIAGETWVSVVRGLGAFADDDLGGFHAWVLTLARRRWIDEVRRRARHPEVPDLLTQGSDRAADDDVEAEVESRLGGEAAVALVRRLPPDQAEVVLLRALSGLSVEHVAAIVGKTPGAVRVLSHRGLRRLAEMLAGVTKSGSATVDEVR